MPGCLQVQLDSPVGTGYRRKRRKWNGPFRSNVDSAALVCPARRLGVSNRAYQQVRKAVSENFKHRLCKLIWIILNKGISCEECGAAVSERSKRGPYRTNDQEAQTIGTLGLLVKTRSRLRLRTFQHDLPEESVLKGKQRERNHLHWL